MAQNRLDFRAVGIYRGHPKADGLSARADLDVRLGRLTLWERSDGCDDVDAPRRHQLAMVGLSKPTLENVNQRSSHDWVESGEECFPGAWRRSIWAGCHPQATPSQSASSVFWLATALQCRDGGLLRG
jgi:hypothetical protein